jgi:ribulose kinase
MGVQLGLASLPEQWEVPGYLTCNASRSVQRCRCVLVAQAWIARNGKWSSRFFSSVFFLAGVGKSP